ncbi:MAG: formate dehydrogenase [Nitrosomonadales bacterium]|jgi:formate dehydrogenase iron-sulfur subunit|nr:formate dehydrogenase [Nitrosomonadales bacterium]MBT3918207.1 formate dehydrogenase [Nitrosomonadales bacterium]MBT4183535.1 formate dehydrogenase [Nitrosomonadales bacterium]MBT5573520.1 formate dehydrogenase [Nitrosomonadales bacterium]MBT6250535.1 formate dehydrogenase [Nitrosomonadales bacterium]
MTSYKIYIPRDSTALSLGADKVFKAIESEASHRGIEIEIIRNGSRGLFWLETMVEVETPKGRVAYGPVNPADVTSLFDKEFLLGNKHPLSLGVTSEIEWLKNQERLTYARVGITDPVSLKDYEAHDGFKGLRKALNLKAQEIVDEVTESGLRGRGGAAFPTGIKWQTVLNAPSEKKYIVCNADEGDSGTFSDRMIMENDPFVLIEGMIIAGLAVGADQGYIYLRSEYPQAQAILNEAIDIAEKNGFLGNNILNTNISFNLEVTRAAGAYICGEETSLLESLEGKRGLVRYKPPLPAIEGLYGKPTVVNNVISLATIPIILDKGSKFYADFGMGRSKGTLPIQLAGNLKQTGLIEKAFGITLRELLYDFGGGSATGKKIKAVQVGGPLGTFLPESQFDTPLDYEKFSEINAVVGHGGIVAFDDTIDMSKMARYSFEFCAIESCGKCTPCRIGSTRGMEVIDKIKGGIDQEKNVEVLKDLGETMVHGSLCAMGGMTPFPVISALNFFPKDFGLETKET